MGMRAGTGTGAGTTGATAVGGAERRGRAIVPAWVPWALVATVLCLLVEPIVIAMTTAPYSVVEQAISDLGVIACGPLETSTGPIETCSPGWPIIDAAMIVSGAAMIASAVALRRFAGVGRVATAALVVAGLSSVGAGAVPLDVSFTWHIVLALPAFPAQGVFLLAAARPLARADGRAWGPVCVVAGVVTLLATLAFVAPVGWGVPFGVVERVAAYLAPLVLAALGVRLAVDRRRRRSGKRQDAPLQ